MPALKDKLKKFLLIFLVLVTFSLGFTPVAYAQGGTWYNQSPAEWYTKVYDSSENEIFGERYTAAQIDWIIWSVVYWIPTKLVGPDWVLCAISIKEGSDLTNCVQAIFKKGESSIQRNPNSNSNQTLVGAVFEERQLSGITYVKNVLRKFSIIPKAEAQGFGFQTALSPILGMWRASRNVAYSLLVLVILILSFMIMFRVKISPQVVISVQSALPKVVMAMILITFSYAIAGFLVDLMYVFIGIVSIIGSTFLSSSGSVSPVAIFNFLTKGQPSGLEVQLGAGGLMGLYLILFLLGLVITLFAMFGLAGVAVTTVLAGAGLAAIAGTAGSAGLVLLFIALVIITVIAIVLLWMTLKTLWILIKSYAMILLLTIFAPFQILLGTLTPAGGFGAWIKSFVSNLAVFVVVGVLILLSYTFVFQGMALALKDIVGQGGIETLGNILFGSSIVNVTQPGQINAGWPPLVGSNGNAGVALLFLAASFVIFTLIPKASDIIKSMIEGKPFAYGSAIGHAVAPLTWAAGTGPGRGIQAEAGRTVGGKFLSTLGNLAPESKLKDILRAGAKAAQTAPPTR